MSTYPQHLNFSKKEERPWQNKQLKHGCIVGHTTTTSTKIWVRVHCRGSYTLVLHNSSLKNAEYKNNAFFDANDDEFTPFYIQTLDIDETTLLTGVFNIDSTVDENIPLLSPGTQYFYRVLYNNDWVLGVQENKHFKTLGEKGVLTFGFFSCHMPFKSAGSFEGVSSDGHIKNWSYLCDIASRQQLDFLIGGGDQVYCDGNKKIDIWAFLKKYKDDVIDINDDDIIHQLMVSWYDDIYRGYWGFSSIRRTLSQFPTYMTWDDHEIMDGWGSFKHKDLEKILKDGLIETKEERKENRKLMYQMFNAASETYYYYQHSHNPTTNITPEIIRNPSTVKERTWHYNFNAKESAFFVMDTRGHKSMDKKSEHYEGNITLLGEKQIGDFKKWLSKEETLAAKTLFITSAVPFIHWKQYVIDIAETTNILGSRDDVRDEWDHKKNHRERDSILDSIFDFTKKSDAKVFILSGDVHCASCFNLKRKGYPANKVFQLTSSAITYAKNLPSWLVKKQVAESGFINGRKHDISFKRLSPVETVNNFATITVELSDDEVKVHFDLYGRSEKDEAMLNFERITM